MNGRISRPGRCVALLGLSLGLVAGCVHAAASEGAVRLQSEAPPEAVCLSLGVVTLDVPLGAQAEAGFTRAAAETALRREAARAGADVVVLDAFDALGAGSGRVRGRAFDCRVPPAPPPIGSTL